MAFIKKQKIEEEVKEVAQQPIVESVEDNLQSALLEVVADELNYVARLNRMIELAEEAGKDDLVKALKTSRKKMKTNIAEIYGKGKEVLGLVEEDEEPKEAVTEAIDPTKTYNGEDVANIISDYTVDLIGSEAAHDIEMIARTFIATEDYTAEEIDAKLDQYQFDPAMRDEIETAISQLPDAKLSRQEEFKSDVDQDVAILEEIKDQLKTYAAWERVIHLKVALENLKYDGAPGVVWKKNDWGQNKGPIISLEEE